MSPRSCVGYILYQSNLNTLKKICRWRGLYVSGSKKVLHRRLRSSFRSSPVELLSWLSKPELKRICQRSELKVSGSKKTLIARILSLELCAGRNKTEESWDVLDDESSYGPEDESWDELKDQISDESEDESWDEPEDESWDDSEDESFDYFEDSIKLGANDLLSLPKKYDYISKIKSGGFGSAFLCHDNKLKRKVVIKKPHEKYSDRIIEEAQIQANFENPNIVNIYEINDDCDQELIVMEYCHQGSLSDKLRDDHTYRDPVITKLLKDIVNGLLAIHSKNIVHKDLGPHNIFLTGKGTAKIGDFGISKVPRNALGFRHDTIPAKGFHGFYRDLFPDDDLNPTYDMFTLGQVMVSCWIGIPERPITRKDLPDKDTCDRMLWSIAWLLLDENPQKRPTAYDLKSILS